MYTPSKIKISMLCALALCGQVRRDDLAIFARTADAGVRTIRELEDKGLIEDKTVEATVRIDGRNRPRMLMCGKEAKTRQRQPRLPLYRIRMEQ